MSLERKMRRMAQQKQNGHPPNNPLAQLTKALGDLQKVQELGQAAKTVSDLGEKLQEAQGLVNELAGLRDELVQALADAGDVRVELGRQRAVFMRFLVDAPQIVAGPQNYIEKFVATETRYRAEYDAMLLLVKLATWAKEAQ